MCVRISPNWRLDTLQAGNVIYTYTTKERERDVDSRFSVYTGGWRATFFPGTIYTAADAILRR